MSGIPLVLPPGTETLVFTAAAAGVLTLAKGFGKRPGDGLGKGWKASEKERKGKVVPCRECKGSGFKACQFCKGTSMMQGFLGDKGDKVRCIPCQGEGTLGIPCPRCKGFRIEQ